MEECSLIFDGGSIFRAWNSMMTKIAVAFDLDGTLSDSSDGIIKSMNYALAEMGRNPLPADRLVPFIGPPITDIFQALLGSPDPSIIMEGVRYFRKRYFDVGFKENRLYEGIPEMLESLKADGHILYIATSKSPQNAVETVRFLGIETYFEAVLGSGIQRKKHDILNDIVSGNNVRSTHAVMIGDRKFDIAAGKHAAMKTIGVTWGFGTREELAAAGADAIIDTVSSLQYAVNELCSSTP